MKTWLSLVFAFCGSLAFAEGEGILVRMDGCMKNAYSDLEEYQCARAGYKAADKLLNYRYQAVKADVDQDGVDYLRESQNKWLNNTRNYQCQANPDTGKTFANTPIGAQELKCFAQKTIARVNLLKTSDY